jgi:hypothetical protein
MKIALIIALSVAAATPAVVIPTVSDAQVLTARRAPRPALSTREVERLNAAQDRVFELTDQITEIEAAGEVQGGLTPEQTAQIEAHRASLARAQETVDQLEAKRARRQG